MEVGFTDVGVDVGVGSSSCLVGDDEGDEVRVALGVLAVGVAPVPVGGDAGFCRTTTGTKTAPSISTTDA